jgi:hypothetical protein
MLYKPTYCSNCGVKIERIEWFPWTSRNFCEVCEKEHKIFDRLSLVLSGVLVFAGFLVFGNYLLSGGNSTSPISEDQPQIKTLKHNNSPKNERAATNQAGNLPTDWNQNSQSIVQSNVASETNPTNPTVQQVQPPTVRQNKNVPVVKAKDPVYFCGAQTKKGTPCSRRVKGGGRCWQHEGQAAMLPPEKLLINQ